MFHKADLLWFPLLLAAVSAQQVGTQLAETHPNLSWQTCTTGAGCTVQSAGSIVLDANWRWTHSVNSTTNCYTGNTWDTTLCPDGVTCANNCALDGANYAGTYGVTTSGDALTMKFVTQSANTNVGARLYLMASDTQYQMFQVLNNEFSFDVDVSQLPCGINGALYFAQMDADGGMANYPTNKAGAKYGTGYCDSQCPQDIKFINGVANSGGWIPDTNSPNTGKGNYGSCCSEMDIWEANSVLAAYTAHPCSSNGQIRCKGIACGGTTNRYGSICDPDGCDYNSYRMGATNFYGSGKTVDTSSKFTVITQFFTDNNSANGTLSEIRRIYIQNGAVIQNSVVNVPGIPSGNSITDDFCTAQKKTFSDTNSFAAHGGLDGISQALSSGVVLVMSLWDDHAEGLLWLDSHYPTNRSPSSPGTARGTCAVTSGVPSQVEAANPNAQVVFSNIKFGPIGSTSTTTLYS